MRDLNFFEPYIQQPEKTSSKRLMGLVVLVVVAFIIVFYPVKMLYEVKALQDKVLSFNAVIESPETISKLKVIEQKELQLMELKGKEVLFNSLETKINSQTMTNDLLIQWILQEVPNDVYFDELNITENTVQVQGRASHKFPIAQIEHNLRHSTYFDEVFIPSIAYKDGHYSFSITFKAKDVTADDVE
ncbi:fimbrial assembly family protein PilN [Clostridium aceticum]|uniref:Fimbrial assembly family protein PilN n=1 Tax=Clostridium aceticum TaxID=84022 RepID=A0A0D8IFY1_9CLOT|nr:PilN domain-containing protein [Clostridium aceticum]AKL95279.1 fimbrial assembly family protein PilN [Clostridium aceticum]KJF28126.1 hypothetical protein TZ02_06175 [Clostridium aceticum]